MTIRKKNILVFCFMILLAVGIYVWSYPLNKGKLSVSANVTEYQIISDENTLECPQSPCVINLKTGVHSIEVQKNGYLSSTISIQIIRGRTIDSDVELIKIPTLNLSEVVPAEKSNNAKNIPAILEGQTIISPVWNSDESNLAYIDTDEEKLKIWAGDNDIRVITSFKNISDEFELSWSPDNQYLFGKEGINLYFINISKASRKKNIIAFVPQNIIWTQKSGSLLFNDDEKNMYLADFSDETIKPLSIVFDLGNSDWDKNGNLISYINNIEGDNVSIVSFNPGLNEKKDIMTKFDFLIGKIVADNEKIFFYNTKDEKWYNLDY